MDQGPERESESAPYCWRGGPSGSDGVAHLETIEARDHATTNRCLPTMSIIGSPGRTTEPGLTRTLLTTPRSSIEGWHRHRARPTPSERRRLLVRPTTWSQFARRGRAPLRRTTSVNEGAAADGRFDPIGRDRFISWRTVRSSVALSAKTSAKAPPQPCPG